MLYKSEGIYQISKTARFAVTSVFNVIVKIAHDQQHPRGGDYMAQVVSELCLELFMRGLVFRRRWWPVYNGQPDNLG